MEVPRESFHKSSWDSRTCYRRRAFNRGFTGNFSRLCNYIQNQEITLIKAKLIFELVPNFFFDSRAAAVCGLLVNGCIRDLLSFLPSDLKFTPSLGPSLFHSLSLGPKVLTVYLPKQLFYYCTTFGQR